MTVSRQTPPRMALLAELAVRRGEADNMCDVSGVEAVPLRNAFRELNWPPITLTGLNVCRT